MINSAGEIARGRQLQTTRLACPFEQHPGGARDRRSGQVTLIEIGF